MRQKGTRGPVKIPFETSDGTAKCGKDYDETIDELFFEDGVTEKDILINIIDGEEYQKNKTFTVTLGTPQVPNSEKTYHEQIKTANGKLTRKKSIKLGAPYVTEKADKIEVSIKESNAFKEQVDMMLKKAKYSPQKPYGPWADQMLKVFTVKGKKSLITKIQQFGPVGAAGLSKIVF